MPRPDRTKIFNYFRAAKAAGPPTLARLEAALDGLIDIVGAERGLVALSDGAGGRRVAAARGLGRTPLLDGDKYVSKTLYDHTIDQTQVGLVSPVLGHPLFAEAQSLRATTRSAIAAPLVVGRKTYGVVMLLESARTKLFDAEERESVELFFDPVANALAGLVEAGAFEPPPPKAMAHRFTSIVGASSAMLDIFEKLEQFRLSPSSVLIEGERGTGKELVARALHHHGPNPGGPFIAVNMATLTPTLFDAELFGAAKGSFTGATESKPGLVSLAAGGTLFLDEFNSIPAEGQAKLLRLLQEKTYRRVGGQSEKKLEARIIAATNEDPRALVRRGRLRADLLDRFVFRVETPPLRKRREDVPLLVAALLPRIAAEEMRPVPALDAATLSKLERRSYPGNVRDLEAALRELVVLQSATKPRPIPEGRARKNAVEITQEDIDKAIEAAKGNKREAARILKVGKSTLYRRLDGKDEG
ncbi:MAG: sigma 54-interacting transcriptional regulator [Planctomycetota bacterium]